MYKTVYVSVLMVNLRLLIEMLYCLNVMAILSISFGAIMKVEKLWTSKQDFAWTWSDYKQKPAGM